MTVAVWTERRAVGSWDQCSECGYLMGLVHGGFTKFPLGIYTGPERDALTGMETDRTAWRAAGKAMFPLIDDASRRRYGIRLRSVTGSTTRATDAQLRAALQVPGNAIVLPGSYASLAAGHPLRRWQPGFTGGHMVTAVVRADLRLLWLDPLATDRFAGDVTDVATAMAFAFPNNDAHVVRAGEFGAVTDTAMPQGDPMLKTRYQGWTAGSTRFPAGTVIYDAIGGAALFTVKAGTLLSSKGESFDGLWRMVEVSRAPGDRTSAYAKRAEMTVLTEPFDAAFDDAVYQLLLSRKVPVPASGFTAADVAAARQAGAALVAKAATAAAATA